GRARRQLLDDGRRQRELLRAERRQQRAERPALLVPRGADERRTAVAAERVDVVHAAEHRGRRLDLVTVMQVQRDEDLLERGERRVALDRRLAEPRERDAA